jgi:hypothetical protein
MARSSIIPWFVIRWENTKVATTNKVSVIQRQEGASRRQELGVINDLHSIAARVEKIPSPQMAKDLYENQK